MSPLSPDQRSLLDQIIERLERGFGTLHAAPLLLRREFIEQAQPVNQAQLIEKTVAELVNFKLPTTNTAAFLIRDLVEERDGLRAAIDQLYAGMRKEKKCSARAAAKTPTSTKPEPPPKGDSDDASARTATDSQQSKARSNS